MEAQHVVLTGPMGSGKTVIGAQLARDLCRPFYDSDASIEAAVGLNAREIAERDGVGQLHELEWQFLETALANSEGAVVAAAASVADRPAQLAQVVDAGHLLVVLDMNATTLAERRRVGRHRRSLTETQALRLQTARRNAVVDVGGLCLELDKETSIRGAARANSHTPGTRVITPRSLN